MPAESRVVAYGSVADTFCSMQVGLNHLVYMDEKFARHRDVSVRT